MILHAANNFHRYLYRSAPATSVIDAYAAFVLSHLSWSVGLLNFQVDGMDGEKKNLTGGAAKTIQ